MATRKGIHISGHYVVSIKAAFSYMYSEFKNLKGRTEMYFIMFIKFNDFPTRCLNFGLRRIHPNGSKFESFYFENQI